MAENTSPKDQKKLPVARPLDEGESRKTSPAASPAIPKDQLPEDNPHRPARKPRLWSRLLWRHTPSWFVSMVVHMLVLVALALISLPQGVTDELRELVLSREVSEELDDLEEPDFQAPEEIDVSSTLVAVESAIEPLEVEVSPVDDLAPPPAAIQLQDFGLHHAESNDLLTAVGVYSGNGLSGRGEAARASLVREAGGSGESEAAVAAALQWLADHQLDDGGWTFNHVRAPDCAGQCRNAGSLDMDSRFGATAMALLPFLGAGQTHRTGRHKTTVKAGLYFLASNMRRTPEGGSLWDSGGHMYSHGLAAIVLCEIYGMTQDRNYREPAQAAIDFIAYAQDPVGGGWRYDPRQQGDTSVVGWQLMALKSAHMAYLEVPGGVATKAGQYLDSVQMESGATYPYQRGTQPLASTTSIGLLCRMYGGWGKDNPALQRGVAWLSDLGPSSDDMYYNYYATQVMRHWEGDEWEKWNNVMRDQLVRTQATEGHEKGSWFMPGDRHGAGPGGRLYCTSMAAMILEVYYRHLPIFRKQSTEFEFPD